MENLRREIADILGMNEGHSAVVLGAGNLGRALIENFHFDRSGFTLAAAYTNVIPEAYRPDVSDITQFPGTPLNLGDQDQRGGTA